jgi:hypothetical protein
MVLGRNRPLCRHQSMLASTSSAGYFQKTPSPVCSYLHLGTDRDHLPGLRRLCVRCVCIVCALCVCVCVSVWSVWALRTCGHELCDNAVHPRVRHGGLPTDISCWLDVSHQQMRDHPEGPIGVTAHLIARVLGICGVCGCVCVCVCVWCVCVWCVYICVWCVCVCGVCRRERERAREKVLAVQVCGVCVVCMACVVCVRVYVVYVCMLCVFLF